MTTTSPSPVPRPTERGEDASANAGDASIATQERDRPSLGDYIGAAEAMAVLQVRPQTLYAYVSRGWICSVAQPGQKEKLYRRIDVDRLRKRSEARSGHGAVAASAMDWGEPILATSITEITPQGPRYRGRLAADLVNAGESFEAVAELLWTGQLPPEPPRWSVRRQETALLALTQAMSTSNPRSNVLEVFAIVVLMLGLNQGSTEQRLARNSTLSAAREIIQAMVSCCGFIGPTQCYRPMQRGETILEALTRSLGMLATAENIDALRALLILLADHELPPGTLSARVVASAGGSLQSCLASAFCATSGIEVGRMYERVQDFLGHWKSRAALMRRALERLSQGLDVPGFHHPLYPDGDPRAAQLLDMVRGRRTQTRESRAIFGFLDEMRTRLGQHPRQELALVMLTRALELPPQAAPALFALARLAGWVAHVREQHANGSLLRPRAKFVP